MKCSYAIFCEGIKIEPSSNQITLEKMFSTLLLDEPGTTTFYYLIGITGIETGTKRSLTVDIHTPNKKVYTATWESPESTDQYTVYNALFNCSQIPFEVEGIYVFNVRVEGSDENISSRSLKVNFKSGSGQ